MMLITTTITTAIATTLVLLLLVLPSSTAAVAASSSIDDVRRGPPPRPPPVVSLHKRFTWDPLMNDFSYLAMLAKRDTCSEVGPEVKNEQCGPGQTSCCTQPGQAFPACEEHVGKGWCCGRDGEDAACYVDQESVCEEASAVHCTNVAAGVSDACCPKFSTCDPDHQATLSHVRCNMMRIDLLYAGHLLTDAKDDWAAAADNNNNNSDENEEESGDSSPKANDETEEPEEEEEVDVIDYPEPAPKPEHEKTSLHKLGSAALIGIPIGGILAVALIAGGIFWLVRRRKLEKSKEDDGVDVEGATTMTTLGSTSTLAPIMAPKTAVMAKVAVKPTSSSLSSSSPGLPRDAYIIPSIASSHSPSHSQSSSSSSRMGQRVFMEESYMKSKSSRRTGSL